MNKTTQTKTTGCLQTIVIIALIAWLGTAPVGVMLVLKLALEDTLSPGVIAITATIIVGVLLLPPFAGAALLAYRRAGWEIVSAVAVALVTITGYLLLDGTVRAISVAYAPALYGEGAWTAALRLALLVPYTLLAAWFVPRLTGVSPHTEPPSPAQRLGAWLGLDRWDGPTLLLALAVAALTTISWPVTGALGDSLTSLSLACQTLAEVIPQVLIFWGLIFRLLTITLARANSRPRWAPLATTMLFAAFTAASVTPTADWGALMASILLLPLTSLLAELRGRGSKSNVYPLLLVLYYYRVVPLLFTDPRALLAQSGIPELQHMLSHVISIVTVMAIEVALSGGRRLLMAIRDRAPLSAGVQMVATALAALLAWCAWGGLYAFAGNPGFANDGFLIILEEQADISSAYTIPGREARLQYVYETLIETAERTQAPLRAELDDRGIPYRPYYITNMIRVDGHRWLMGRFEKQAGVARVIFNPNVRTYAHAIPIPNPPAGPPPPGVQANLSGIHADDAWALGVTGEGIIVGGQDTGYDWTHPVLQPHYRGWDGQSANHDYNWHDAWDNTAVPFDDDSHGTHTMGTVLGDDGERNHTGVAPGARWIGCRNMRRAYGNPASYAECMEFFIAPYPHGGDPFSDGDVSLAPHIVTNSWGCPDWEGCSPDTFETAVEALRAAGIMMVVSVGNDGPGCETALVPPGNYDAVFSVGATSNSGRIVGFSSRGPVDGSIKPDVTAPGEAVRSSVPGGEYASFPGTSMAGPHVAGLAALLWSADPALIGDVEATEALICRTAAPRPVENVCTFEDQGSMEALLSDSACACGGVTGVPNNIYGCGFIDAEAAVRAALGQ